MKTEAPPAMALRPAAGASISWKLNSYREGQHADHRHGDQPRQPFYAVEAQQPAVAPNVRGQDTTPWPQNRFTRVLWEAQPLFWRPELRGHPPPYRITPKVLNFV